MRIAAEDYNNYEIITQRRTRESRDISHCSAELIEEILKNGHDDFRLSRTPGRTNFTLVFTDPSRFCGKRWPIGELYDIFGKQWPKIDDIVTTIGYRQDHQQYRGDEVTCPVCGPPACGRGGGGTLAKTESL